MKPRLAVVACAVSLLAAACGGVNNLNIPTPPSSAGGPDSATTVVADLSQTSLTPVPAQPPRTIALGPGKASLAGTVTGPGGLVPGATVLIERLVGDAVASKTITALPDGTWKMAGILGGRYRVRAWLAPTLAMTMPQILFLNNTDNQNLTLPVTMFDGTTATAAVAPNPPPIGAAVTVVVQVTVQTVATDGVVRATAVAGDTVELIGSPVVTITGTNPGLTDIAGRVAFQMTCSAAGPSTLQVTVNTIDTFPLNVADCGALVALPTSTVPGTPTTSTTIKRPPPTTAAP